MTVLPPELAAARGQLLNHPLYQQLQTSEDVCLFMEHHVFSVWDFQTLLKGLQAKLTCVTLPWLPTEDSESRRLINEIVLGEESDEDGKGGHLSHYELYRGAMQNAGADTSRVDLLLELLRQGRHLSAALQIANVPPATAASVEFSLALASEAQTHELAAAFLWGREDLIPDLFSQLLNQLGQATPSRFGRFLFYLERHVQVDGDAHGPHAQRLLQRLCGDDPVRWQEANAAALKSLEARLAVWNEIGEAIGHRPCPGLVPNTVDSV